MKHERALAYAAFLTVCLVWGTTYLAIRVAIETIPPFLLTGIRFTVAGLILVTISLARGHRLPRDWRILGNLALIGVLMVVVGNLSVVWAEKYVPSGMAALLVATGPLWMALMEALRTGGERVNLRRGVGMLVGFIGVALLVTPRGAGGRFEPGFILGALAIQVGTVGWNIGTYRGKYHLPKLPPLLSSGVQALIGGVVVGSVGLALGEAPRFHVTMRTSAALAYLTIFGSLIAFSAYVYALSKMSTTSISLYAYVNPAVAVVLGWLILSEKLTWVSVTAMVVILAGVALVQGGGIRGRLRSAAETTRIQEAA
ncbi:MAG TPA: EamA family transporter [Thermoanaerobaculia bacterium]|nr:EamA family transporter [Thermoanaerobaculia bacterium]